MVHTVHIIRIWYNCMCMVWLFVPYVYCYYTITVYKQHIAIANTILLFVLDHELYHSAAFCMQWCFAWTHSDKLVISRLTMHLACSESHLKLNYCYTQLTIAIMIVHVLVCNILSHKILICCMEDHDHCMHEYGRHIVINGVIQSV